MHCAVCTAAECLQVCYQLSAMPGKHRAIVKSAEDLKSWAGIEAEVEL